VGGGVSLIHLPRSKGAPIKTAVSDLRERGKLWVIEEDFNSLHPTERINFSGWRMCRLGVSEGIFCYKREKKTRKGSQSERGVKQVNMVVGPWNGEIDHPECRVCIVGQGQGVLREKRGERLKGGGGWEGGPFRHETRERKGGRTGNNPPHWR